MKIFSRDFTLKEKILLLILCLILVGLAYYKFVDQPVRDAIATANAERESMEVELTAVQAKVIKLETMRTELDAIASGNNASMMGSYNNSKAEMKMLNDILDRAEQYSISFTDITRNGDQIRRNFTLQFRASSYDNAMTILRELARGEYRCMVNEVRCTAEEGSVLSGPVSISATATFYETMVGGTPDAGLPEDSSAVPAQSETVE
ncbi:MAG: hypothetical protein ACI4F1_01340 [Bariatricus sp.]